MEGLMLKLLWSHLAGLRFMLCISPQFGYVFPDEFFQSPEIMAGDILELTHRRTWEWDPKSPARSVIFPLISSGIPFFLVRFLSSRMGFLITPYSLLLVPRVWMTLQSFLTDYFIYKIACCMFKDKKVAHVAPIIFASSYTCWVYCTRTFSNGTETTLLALLLYLVALQLKKPIIVNENTELVEEKENATCNVHDPGHMASLENKTLPDEQMHSKLKPNDSTLITRNSRNRNDDVVRQGDYYYAYLLSVVIVTGFFIRTSFVGFAFIPVMYWIFKVSVDSNCSYIRNVIKRSLALVLGACITFIVLVMIDSVYFNPEKFFEFPNVVQQQNAYKVFQWLQTLPVTPLNNLLYNFNPANLEKHGIHPWFLHGGVNLPLLFGPLVFVLMNELISKIVHPATSGEVNKDVFALLVGTFTCGLISLSLVPHQEPRYLLPLIVPISLICAKRVYPFSSHKFVVSLWISFNFFGFGIFGLFHQGGVVPCMDYVGSLVTAQSQSLSHNTKYSVKVIFYKTYKPPEHLAVHHSDTKGSEFFEIIDLAGASFEKLEQTLDSSLSDPGCQVYLAMPASLPCAYYRKLRHRYRVEEYFSVFPHLSMEDPPWNDHVCRYPHENDLHVVVNRMSLSVYQVELFKRTMTQSDDAVVRHAYYAKPTVKTSVS